MNFRVVFFAISIISLTFFSCEQGDNKIKDLRTSEEKSESKQVTTEIITRTFSVKFVNKESVMDTLQQIQSVTIDAVGKEIERTFYNLDFTPKWTDKYEYDEKGNQVGSKHFNAGAEQTLYYKYTNDSDGRRIFYEAYDFKTDALIHNGASSYENDGKLKKDGYINDDGKFVSNFEYEYNNDGDELGYTYIDLLSGDRSTSNYKYLEFNDDKQWTKRLVLTKGEVQSIETREFKEK